MVLVTSTVIMKGVSKLRDADLPLGVFSSGLMNRLIDYFELLEPLSVLLCHRVCGSKQHE